MGFAIATAATDLDTRDKILEAAEVLFIERGYASTSLRAIASAAGVNLAATNYHFGSKLGLLQAVFHRRVKPINEQRLLKLQQLRDGDAALTTRNVLEAFFRPLAEDSANPRLIGRVLSEPESITRPILEQEFFHVIEAFQSALSEILPHLSPQELDWRFHFTVGSMIHTLHFQAPMGRQPSVDSFADGLEHLIAYAAAGLEQTTSGHRYA